MQTEGHSTESHLFPREKSRQPLLLSWHSLPQQQLEPSPSPASWLRMRSRGPSSILDSGCGLSHWYMPQGVSGKATVLHRMSSQLGLGSLEALFIVCLLS